MELQSALAPFYARFLIRADDVRQVKRDKVRLLRAVMTVDNHQALLRELIVSSGDHIPQPCSHSCGSLN